MSVEMSIGTAKSFADFEAKHADFQLQINEQLCSLCIQSIEGRARASTSAAVYHHGPLPTVDTTQISSNTSSSDEVYDTTTRMDESSGFLAPGADNGALNKTLSKHGETPIQKRKATVSIK